MVIHGYDIVKKTTRGFFAKRGIFSKNNIQEEGAFPDYQKMVTRRLFRKSRYP